MAMIEIFDDAEAVSERAAGIFFEEFGRKTDGPFSLVLAGGRTPRRAYELIAGQSAGRVDWGRVEFFFGDERCVPPLDKDSNYLMASEALIDRVKGANVHRVRGEALPEDAAHEHDAEVRRVLGDEPAFDLVYLGMGADGHTASLFPGAGWDTDDGRLVRAVPAEAGRSARVTLTLRAINNAGCIVFLVAGREKASALAGVLEGGKGYPASGVRPRNGRLIWLLDKSAASLLNHPEA